MAEKSYFFNDVNDDRVYLAEDFAMFFSTLIANGIFPNPSTNTQVIANEENPMTVKIMPGKAWINGYLYWNPDNLVKTLEPAYTNPRIDRVVIRWSSNNREIMIGVITGTPAASPMVPELTRNSDVWELSIADIFVGGNVAVISQANITDTRLSNNLCGIVHALVQQVDTTTLFIQYQSWIAEKQSEFNADLVDYESTKQIEIDQIKADFQSGFLDFMTSIQTTLSGDVAGNLLSLINANTADISQLQTFQTAGGTATAITLTGVELVDGFQTTLVIASSNSGAATTINGKNLYKPGTTTAPKLIAGKAATVWYNLVGDCFFIKASAEGDSTTADVLAGKTFSNDDDTGLVGTFAVPHGSQSYTTPGTYTFTIPANVTQVTFAVGGAGGGGGGGNGYMAGSGGGAGGVYTSTLSVLPFSTYSVTVGAKGLGGHLSTNAYNGGTGAYGENSSFASYVGAGGAGGGGGSGTSVNTGPGLGGIGGMYGGNGIAGTIGNSDISGPGGAGTSISGGGGSGGARGANGTAGLDGKVIILW